MTMKTARICSWRCFRPILVWTLCFLALYYYSEKASNSLEIEKSKISRFNKLEVVNNKPTQETMLEYLVSLVKRHENTDTDLNSQDLEEVADQNTSLTTVQSDSKFDKSFINKKINNDNLILAKSNLIGYIEKDHLENNFLRRNSTTNVVNVTNGDFIDNGDDLFSDGSALSDKVDETKMRHLQGTQLVSALRERVPNSLMLKLHRLHWTISWAGSYSEKLFSPPPHEMPQQRLPQAIIIGFGKCGTRALLDFMNMHPNIVTTGPEIHFYDVDENFVKGLDWYKAQMPLSYSNQITLEKTPSYIWSERAMTEIYKLNSHMKLIVIMKDPVTRIVSQALRSGQRLEEMTMCVKDGQLQVNTDSRTLQWSIYSNYLQKWMNKFPRSQIHILETSEFIQHPATELQKIEVFLGVPQLITEKNFYFNSTKGYFCKRPFHINEIECLSEGKGRKHPPLNPTVEKKLYNFFNGHNQDLFRLIGRSFKWEPKQSVIDDTDMII